MQFYQTRSEFLDCKKKTIGASEVGIILGVSKFETRYELWHSKVNQTIKDSNKYMDAGNMLESAIVERFYKNRNIPYERDQGILTYSHPEYDFIMVHPDNILNGERLLEVKTTQKYLVESIVEEYVKEAYFPQWNFTLGIIIENNPDFLRSGFLVILSRGLDYFEIPFSFDEELYKKSLAEAIAFKQLIDSNTPPELEKTDYDLVYNFSTGGDLYSNDELDSLYQQLVIAAKEVKQSEEKKEDLIVAVKAILKEKERIINPSTNRIMITWKNTARGRVFRVYDDN